MCVSDGFFIFWEQWWIFQGLKGANISIEGDDILSRLLVKQNAAASTPVIDTSEYQLKYPAMVFNFLVGIVW